MYDSDSGCADTGGAAATAHYLLVQSTGCHRVIDWAVVTNHKSESSPCPGVNVVKLRVTVPRTVLAIARVIIVIFLRRVT